MKKINARWTAYSIWLYMLSGLVSRGFNLNILFVHDAFPAQFTHLFRHLLKDGSHRLMVACRKGSVAKVPCKQFVYDVFGTAKSEKWGLGTSAHAYELGLNLAKQVAGLAGSKHQPDIILSHASTGASFYLKDIFPNARFVSLFEWYYQQPKLVKDSEIQLSKFIKKAHEASMKNLPIEREFALADAAYVPTGFQKSQFPPHMSAHMEQIHDGIDTDLYSPDAGATFTVGEHSFKPGGELITYAARGMEHTRGFPQFMKAVSSVLKARPNAHVVIAAADRVCYGNRAEPGLKKWATETLNYDPARVHFVGLLPEPEFVKMLQVSSLHVYLSIPFVLSWSMLNAMSVGARVLAADNAPVREVISDGENGYLVGFDNVRDIAERMTGLLREQPQDAQTGALRRAARQTILDRYDLRNSLKKQLKLIGVSG